MFKSRAFKSMEKELDYFKSKYLHRQGFTSMNGTVIDYELLSTNGGQDWYVIDKHGKIIGEVEAVYPNLMTHLLNIDKLSSGDIEAVASINF